MIKSFYAEVVQTEGKDLPEAYQKALEALDKQINAQIYDFRHTGKVELLTLNGAFFYFTDEC